MKLVIFCWFQLKIACKKTCILLPIVSSYEIYLYINWLLLVLYSLCSEIKQAPTSRVFRIRIISSRYILYQKKYMTLL